jgi:glycosyltransferase involved in cell wall biosynthesis
MQPTGVSVVIPAFNEEYLLPQTLDNLAQQLNVEYDGTPMFSLRIIVVDNGSTDRTVETVKNFAQSVNDAEVILLHEHTKGFVQARMRGMSWAVAQEDPRAAAYLISSDADTTYPVDWISIVIAQLQSLRADVASCPSYYPDSLWENVPRLVDRYLSEVGTINFGPTTIQRLGLAGQTFLFTVTLYENFVRSLAGAGCGMRRGAYIRSGGFVREFLEGGQEDYEEGFRLQYKFDRIGARTVFLRNAPIYQSPRRLLQATTVPFSRGSYAGGMTDYRAPIEPEQYAQFERDMADFDWEQMRRRLVQNQIIRRCISDPDLLQRNPHYFDGFLPRIRAKIEGWADAHPTASNATISAYAKEIADEFYSKLIGVIEELRMRA